MNIQSIDNLGIDRVLKRGSGSGYHSEEKEESVKNKSKADGTPSAFLNMKIFC